MPIMNPSTGSSGNGSGGSTVSEVLSAINDGTRTLSPARINIGSDYQIRQGANGRLQIYQNSELIQEQDDEGAWIASSVRTGTGSLHIGDLHDNGSGGENVIWLNTDSNIAYYPSWGGVTIDGQSTYEMSDRIHEDRTEIEPHGLASNSGELEYNFELEASGGNTSFYVVGMIPAEDYSGRLRWKATKVDTNKVVAEFFFDVNLTADSYYPIQFKYPLWTTPNVNVRLQIIKDDGSFLKTRPSVDKPDLPYRKLVYRQWKDYTAINASHLGFVVYDNNGTAQTLTEGSWTTLENTGNGAGSNDTYASRGNTGMLSSNKIELSSLSKGDQVILTHRLKITPNTIGQTLEIRSWVGTTGNEYSIPSTPVQLTGAAGSQTDLIIVSNIVYIDNDNAVNGGLIPQIKTSGPSTLDYEGVTVSVFKGGK